MPYIASPRYTTADPLSHLLTILTQDAAPFHPRSQPQHSSSCQPAAKKPYKPMNRSIRAFTPNFDVMETESSYILEGELPGLSDKRAIDIEFTDDRTLMIRGRIEKNKKEEEKGGEDNNKRRSLNPTVEDTTDDDDDNEYTVVKTKEPQQTTTTTEKKKEEGHKTWVSERTFGNFQRTFSFPTGVDVEGVKAELEAGVLTISVPKRVAKGARRIEIH